MRSATLHKLKDFVIFQSDFSARSIMTLFYAVIHKEKWNRLVAEAI